MTSLLLLHCLRCHRGDARGSVGRAGGGVLSAQTCQESRSTSACLGLAPEALPAQQNQAQTCLPVCLSAWGQGLSVHQILHLSPGSLPRVHILHSTAHGQTLSDTHHKYCENKYSFFFCSLSSTSHNQALHQATQLGNHSISAYHLISVSHSGSLAYVNQCESSVLHVHV